MTRDSRAVSWISAARRDFEKFPAEAQTICLTALTVAAEGGKADIAKPLTGLGAGVLEIALPHRGNAFAWYMRCSWAAIFGSCLRSRKNPHREFERPGTRLIW